MCVGGGVVTEHNSDRTEHRDEVGKTATLEKFNSGNDCFCKKCTLGNNKFGTLMAPLGHRRKQLDHNDHTNT